jgi:protein SCO1/2
MKLLTLFVLFLVAARFAWAEDARPTQLQGVGIDQRLNEQVPLDLPFRDETGKTIKLGDYFGKKPVILALVYYECPMLCTLTLNGLVRAMRALPFDAGNQYTVVTVSFNPRETYSLAAAKKLGYVKSYRRPGGAEGWHFLTGEESSIEKLTHAVGFHYNYDVESGQYAHATGLVVLTPQGKISRYFYGVEFSPRDLRLALDEASANKIGSPVDAILLFCCRYDPVTGKYGLVISRVMQLAGGVTVLVLGGFMALMLWREKHGKLKNAEGQ